MARKRTRTMTVNIMNFIDINDINDILDDTLADEGRTNFAEDISYEFLEVSKDGICKIRAKFNMVE